MVPSPPRGGSDGPQRMRALRIRARAAAARRLLMSAILVLSWSTVARAQLNVCARDGSAIAAGLVQLEQSVDPCGESAEIHAVIDRVRRCASNTYNLCTDATATRNLFDRPPFDQMMPRAITWNPSLRTEVELECSADPRRPLLRDPTASLLHELVHAAQDCDGLNPGEHELEAVRIENVYRRAAGLCQRTGYGDETLPPSMVVSCSVGPCLCSASEPQAPQSAVAGATGPGQHLTETSGDGARN